MHCYISLHHLPQRRAACPWARNCRWLNRTTKLSLPLSPSHSLTHSLSLSLFRCTWTRDRHSRAGFDVDLCCPVCRDTRETPIHRWWVCPRWDVLRGHEGRRLAIEAEAAGWQPRCLWECGLLPAPSPEDCLPAPPHEANCGKPRQRRFPGKYLVYTDASAMRPKDPYLRRAACAFWAGDSKSDSAA